MLLFGDEFSSLLPKSPHLISSFFIYFFLSLSESSTSLLPLRLYDVTQCVGSTLDGLAQH